MRTQRGCKKVKLVFHRSFRRPVKIRVETGPPRSADRTASLIPAGILLLAAQRQGISPGSQLRVIRLQLPPPDWPTVGGTLKLEMNQRPPEE